MNKLQIDLTVDQTNLVLEALGQLPYHRVASLIASIQQQAQEQLQTGHTDTSRLSTDHEDANSKS